MNIRIRFEYERDIDLSFLEQWDTPEKYYGETPKCSHDFDMKYDGDHAWICDHDMEEGLSHDARAVKNGHGTEKGGVALDPRTKEPIPFEDYMKSYGDPERHVVLSMLVERQCGHCGAWNVVDSLGNIDFMDFDTYHVGTFPREEVEGWAEDDYQRSIAMDGIHEAEKADDCCEPQTTIALVFEDGKSLTMDVDNSHPLAASNTWRLIADPVKEVERVYVESPDGSTGGFLDRATAERLIADGDAVKAPFPPK